MNKIFILCVAISWSFLLGMDPSEENKQYQTSSFLEYTNAENIAQEKAPKYGRSNPVIVPVEDDEEMVDIVILDLNTLQFGNHYSPYWMIQKAAENSLPIKSEKRINDYFLTQFQRKYKMSEIKKTYKNHPYVASVRRPPEEIALHEREKDTTEWFEMSPTKN